MKAPNNMRTYITITTKSRDTSGLDKVADVVALKLLAFKEDGEMEYDGIFHDLPYRVKIKVVGIKKQKKDFKPGNSTESTFYDEISKYYDIDRRIGNLLFKIYYDLTKIIPSELVTVRRAAKAITHDYLKNLQGCGKKAIEGIETFFAYYALQLKLD